MKKKVSIIITARNYGKFLAEAIESCLVQSVDCEVIYSDDCSEDNSLEIARQYPVKIIEHYEHVGVAAARNDGAKNATGKYYLFVDGDDILPSDYVARHLEVMDKGVPFVYGAAQAFGLHDRFWDAPNWNEKSLWHQNYVNTCSLIRAEVFWKAGAWQETPDHTMWDWSLALRMSRFGKPRKSPAILHYRQHRVSNKRNIDRSKAKYFYQRIRQRELVMTVGVVYAGRLPQLFSTWINALVADIQCLENKPELIIVNNSGGRAPDLDAYNDKFREVKVITGRTIQSWNNERDRRLRVSTLLAHSYNLIQELSIGDIIHLREDDIIPDNDAFNLCYQAVTQDNPLKAAVAGIYRNRHHQRVVGGKFSDNVHLTRGMNTVPRQELLKVDYTGTGFLFYWKDLSPACFQPTLKDIAAHDWRWGADLNKLGQELYLLPHAVCRHYMTEDEYVMPGYGEPINSINNHTVLKRENPKESIIRKKALNAN